MNTNTMREALIQNGMRLAVANGWLPKSLPHAEYISAWALMGEFVDALSRPAQAEAQSGEPEQAGELDSKEFKAAMGAHADAVVESRQLGGLRTSPYEDVKPLIQSMIVSSSQMVDASGDVVGYQIKTGSLHKLVGLLGLFIPNGLPVVATQPAEQAQSGEKMVTPYITEEHFNRAFPEPTLAPSGDGERAELITLIEGRYDACLRDGRLFDASAFRAARRALLAQDARPAAVPPWQPIETAPKDGTEIIVAFKSVGVRQVS